MIRLGICDDDSQILEIMKNMVVSQYGEQIQVQTFTSSGDLMSHVDEWGGLPLDIILIDIVLSRESGITLAKKLQNISSRIKIIFMTGHIEFAPDIFQIEPVYLLKKPVSILKLVDAIDRAVEKIRQEEQHVITLQGGGNVLRVNSYYITYVETDGRKLLIHQNNETASVYMKLDDLEKKLDGPFLRCHHSYLVNMVSIKNFSSQEIELMDGTKVPVSRPKSKAAKAQFLSYLGEEL